MDYISGHNSLPPALSSPRGQDTASLLQNVLPKVNSPWEFWDYPELYREFHGSLGYRVRPCVIKPKPKPKCHVTVGLCLVWHLRLGVRDLSGVAPKLAILTPVHKERLSLS